MNGGRRSRGAAEELEAVASVVQRLAVLVAAGVPPASAWGYLAEPDQVGGSPGPGPGSAPGPGGPSAPGMAAEVVAEVRAGAPVDEAIRLAADRHGEGTAAAAVAGGWRGLAAAWSVATEAGAPIAGTLDEFAAALRDLAQTEREVRIALAGPTATARMVMALPAVGVLFGAALGFDTLGTLFGTPMGFGCLASGLALMLAARLWNRRLLRSAASGGHAPGLALDLTAIAVSGGASTERAASAVARACKGAQIPLDHDSDIIEGVFALSRRAGVPAAGLLRSEAVEARRRSRSEGARRAATLSVTLMLPLGLCVLPAFMLLGVAPLMVAVISSTVANF